jgi:hypothetical protein
MILSSLPRVTTPHKMTAKDTMKKGKHMNEKLKIVVIGGSRDNPFCVRQNTGSEAQS